METKDSKTRNFFRRLWLALITPMPDYNEDSEPLDYYRASKQKESSDSWCPTHEQIFEWFKDRLSHPSEDLRDKLIKFLKNKQVEFTYGVMDIEETVDNYLDKLI